ncbi:unnamed protein product [Nesidiocoris tenuis]|uniref:Uncharacterized protein n=1 Tax=Nesidiocoris tenuis TaxID=355587 RepID=A0A6H5G4R9_9HEMI|nr:unnamed protein product [Nesidiocoris tenuis]
MPANSFVDKEAHSSAMPGLRIRNLPIIICQNCSFSEIPVHFNENLHRLRCGGVEIHSVKFSHAKRRPVQQKPTMEEHTLPICYQVDISVAAFGQDIDSAPEGIKIWQPPTLEAALGGNWDLVLGADLLSDKSTMATVVGNLSKNCFLLMDVAIGTDLKVLDKNLELIVKSDCGERILLLCRKGAPVPWQGAMLRLLRTSQLQGHNARYGKTAARCTTWEFSWAASTPISSTGPNATTSTNTSTNTSASSTASINTSTNPITNINTSTSTNNSANHPNSTNSTISTNPSTNPTTSTNSTTSTNTSTRPTPPPPPSQSPLLITTAPPPQQHKYHHRHRHYQHNLEVFIRACKPQVHGYGQAHRQSCPSNSRGREMLSRHPGKEPDPSHT